jgi:hypothetical protein
VLQLRNFLAQHLSYPRPNHPYSLSQMVLALVYLFWAWIASEPRFSCILMTPFNT